jgi:uracil-DNA glycosylase
MKFLNNQQKPIVFMLWGNDAIKYQKYLTNNKFLILTSSHPSPLSVYRGFRGCKHFSIANEYLKSNNINIINY